MMPINGFLKLIEQYSAPVQPVVDFVASRRTEPVARLTRSYHRRILSRSSSISSLSSNV